MPAKSDKKVVVLNGDDWSGVYVDGKLVYENHGIPLRELAKHAGVEVVDVDGGDEAWEPYGYRCPRTLGDFKPQKG